MKLQEQFDAAIFAFSQGKFDRAIAHLQAVLAADATYFEAQLALGMAYFRQGNFTAAIAEGHRAEQLNPKEPLVQTNLSLFYMKAGDIAKAEHHGLQARIAGWRAENAAANAGKTHENAPPTTVLARPKVKVIRMPDAASGSPTTEKVEDGNAPSAKIRI